MFQDYKINGLESNRVYELTLSIPMSASNDNPQGNNNDSGDVSVSNAKRKEATDIKAKEEQRLRLEKEAEQKRILAKQKLEKELAAKQKADSIAKERELLREKEEILKAQKKAEAEKMRAEKKKEREAKHRNISEGRSKMPYIFGVRGGLNFATGGISLDEDKAGMIMAFNAGLNMDIRLSDNIYLNTGLLYSSKGYKFEGEFIEEEANPQYIDIPIQISYRIPIGFVAQLQLNAGVYGALCVSGTVKDNTFNHYYDESFKNAFNGFDYGTQIGIGMIYSHHYFLGINYQLGLNSTYQNRNLSISLGYNF